MRINFVVTAVLIAANALFGAVNAVPLPGDSATGASSLAVRSSHAKSNVFG
jgi:hypothetical protein